MNGIRKRAIEIAIHVIAGVVTFMALEQLMGDFVHKYSILLIVVGIALILFSKAIMKKTKIPDEFLQVAGGVVSFLGTKYWIQKYIQTSAWYMLIIALLLIVFSGKISELIQKI